MHLLPVPDLCLPVGTAVLHLFQPGLILGDLRLLLTDQIFLHGNILVDLHQFFRHGILLVALLLHFLRQRVHVLFQFHHADLQL